MADRSTIYLNQAGTSWPKPSPVEAAVASALQADPADWPEQFQKAHAQIAAFFHISDPSRLLLTPGGTSALAVAVADHLWSAGDRVLTSGLEHHALHRPLLKLTEQGVRLEVLPRTDSEPVVLAALAKALSDGGVRLVALSAASNVTGELLPVAEAIELAHRYGALVCVDAAQVAGWWDLDVVALGADLLAFTGHKALNGPWGIGGLYVSPEVAMNSPAASCEVQPGQLPSRCSTLPGYCDTGSVDRLALAGLAAAVGWLQEPEQANRLARCREMARSLAQAAQAIPQVTVHGSTQQAGLPTVALTVEGRQPADLAAAFSAVGIIVSAGLQCAPLAHQTLGTDPNGVVRLSIGLSNQEDQIHAVVEMLPSILKR